MSLSSTALANNQAKINLAHKAILTGRVSPYATPSLRQLLKQADVTQFKIDIDLGCEMSEHYYLGHGNGDLVIENLETKVLKDGTVLSTFTDREYREYRAIVHFKMICKKEDCKIDDVNNLREDAQSIVDTYSCSGLHF